jgi:LPS export ABC transporter permease LptF/LPS export ABC transporter permease LptG
MKILDRYLVREIIPPLIIGLVLLTFALMLPPILQQGARLIEKGVDWKIILRVLWTLVPQALSITIPMALLLGILVGLGRMSADREFVALQACGISVFRVLRPIVLLAVAGVAATAYETLVATPEANQTFRQITFNVVASRAESDIKPRVFFQEFPNRVLYVRDIPPGATWKDVFVADSTKPDQTMVYFAHSGRLVVDRAKRTVQLLLEQGTVHAVSPNKPETYDTSSFERLLLNMDAETVFPRTQVIKGDNEMTIAELRQRIEEITKAGGQSYSQLYTIQQKFSIPAACLVLSLIGVALGVSNRRDGKLATIALGVGVVFVYYMILYGARAGAMAGKLSPTFAPWIVNVLLGAVGVALVIWRAGAADQPIRINIPRFWSRSPTDASGTAAPVPARRVVLVIRIPHVGWPRPRLLDLYVSRLYLSIFGLSFVALVGIFYISTFIDLADRLFRGVVTTGLLLRFFYFQTPQYVYYIIPLSVLVATLVTVGLLTKNSELIVMRACGISLYRSALPLMLFAALFSGILFELQEHVLPDSNQEAGRLNAIIHNWPVQTFGTLTRRWIAGNKGDIYYYDSFDPRTNQFAKLSLFRIDEAEWKLGALVYAQNVALERRPGTDGATEPTWVAHRGWNRQFTTTSRQNTVRTVVAYEPFDTRDLALEPPSYFRETVDPDADRMTYGQLKAYVAQLRTSGYHAVPYMVQLQQKVAFPFVTLVMTMIAVPFAVSTGRRGALSGIGIGIVLAIVYRIAMVVFGALGAGGWLSPTIGAWAPNILFGAVALYLVLTVRT